MKHRLLTIGTIVLVLVLGLAAAAAPALANGGELLFADSPELIWAELDLLQDGRAMPTSVYPLTQQEYFMTVLDMPLTESPTVSSKFIFTLHPYWAGFDVPYGGPATQTVYLYDRIPSMLEIGDALSVQNWLHARVVIDQAPAFYMLKDQGAYAPWEFGSLVNLEFPRIGYGTLALPHFNLSAGRFKTGIGNGHFGNTFLNGLAPRYDQAQFSIYTGKVKFFYMLGTSSPFLSAAEAAIQKSTTNWDPWNNQEKFIFDDPTKMFAYHRLEFHPFDWATIGLHEMNIIGGKSPDFNHINPFGFWHNTYTSGYSNVMFGGNASLVPFRGLNIYSEITVDDIRAGWAEASDSKPTSLAWQAGARYVLPWSSETKHVVGAEFTHVDPWTYNRWQPYLIMYQRMLFGKDSLYVDVPLGYTYGGDLNHYGAYYALVRKDGLRVDASYDHLDKGPIELGMLDTEGHPVYYNHEDYPNVTTGPFGHGVVEQKDTLSLSATYPLPWNLEAMGSVSYSWYKNFGHVEGVAETMSMVYLGIRWRF